VGKAAEPCDQILVQLAPVQPVRLTGLGRQFFEQRHSAGLGGGVFMMLKGQIEKAAQHGLGRQVKAACQRPVRNIARQLVGGEGKRAMAVEIAGELVGDQDQGQRARRVRFPGRQMAGRRLVMQRSEMLANGGIEGRVGGEPPFGSRFAPEGDDVLRFNGA
jgi:hypothetical protein